MSGIDMRKIMEAIETSGKKKQKINENIGSPMALSLKALGDRLEAISNGSADELTENKNHKPNCKCPFCNKDKSKKDIDKDDSDDDKEDIKEESLNEDAQEAIEVIFYNSGFGQQPKDGKKQEISNYEMKMSNGIPAIVFSTNGQKIQAVFKNGAWLADMD